MVGATLMLHQLSCVIPTFLSHQLLIMELGITNNIKNQFYLPFLKKTVMVSSNKKKNKKIGGL